VIIVFPGFPSQAGSGRGERNTAEGLSAFWVRFAAQPSKRPPQGPAVATSFSTAVETSSAVGLGSGGRRIASTLIELPVER
jgi:hypothetical protein